MQKTEALKSDKQEARKINPKKKTDKSVSMTVLVNKARPD